MRVLGIDFGDRQLGLALSDALGITAQPFGTYRLSALASKNREFFETLVRKHDIGEIVIGEPLRMDGSRGTRAKKTREFAAWVEQTVSRPVFFMDERLTSREALSILRGGRSRGREKKEREDQISAVIILATYLERKQGERHGSQSG